MRRNVFHTYDPSLPLGKKFVAVHVQNEDPLYFLVEVKSKVRELFVQISKFLNLLEPELFGLAIKSSDTFIFMDPLEKLSKFAPKPWRTQNNGMDNDGLPLFQVYFRVQFYVDSYLYISDKNAKFYYYHQLRENVLRYEMSMREERTFLLASYALQADYGNYNPKLHRTPYFDPCHYFPQWVIAELGVDYIVRHLPTLHCDLKGMSKSEAQSMFIREASDPVAPHNFHLYKMSSKSHHARSSSAAAAGAITVPAGQDVWLAVTITGLMIFSPEMPQRPLKTRISFFPWTDIGKLSFDKRKFEIRSTGPQSRKFIYYAASEELARFILWLTRASHQFHLMVLPKMCEMLKREAEINRRKYRETCVSSIGSTRTGSSRTSSGNSSGGATTSSSSPGSSAASSTGSTSSSGPGGVGGGVSVGGKDGGGTSSNNTSKSVSPFEFSSVASTSSSSDDKKLLMAGECSDLEMSPRRCGPSSPDDDHHHPRVSVISNASSNTTSGIASEKLGHGIDSDRDDQFESDLLMSLNHRLAAHRTVTLSGCSPQPVVSMESLAMSEPVDHSHHLMHQNSNRNHSSNKLANNLARNKKHSISISNIMITESPQPVKVTTNTNASYQTTPEVNVVNNNSATSKVSLCLNINESRPKSKDVMDGNGRAGEHQNDDNDDDGASSAYDDDDDDADSMVFETTKHGSGKSNVTVLSTILKPEAERLLKQGIDVVDNPAAAGELLIDDGIDSLELAELKEFEQAEKEKIILNSLIDNIPPPPGSIVGHHHRDSDDSSDDDSSSSSSYSDDDDDDENSRQHRLVKKYSPLSQEKRRSQSNRCRTAGTPKPPPSQVSNGRLRSKSHSQVSLPKPVPTAAPIYENVPPPAPENTAISGDQPETPRPRNRTGMRIGVSSLSRPGSTQRHNHLLLQTAIAGSEPNLYLGQASSQQQRQPPSTLGYGHIPGTKSDSVYDCRRISAIDDDSFMMTPNGSELYLDTTNTAITTTPTTFRQFIKNQLPQPPPPPPPAQQQPRVMELSLNLEKQQDSNNNNIRSVNHGSMMMTPPPSADYHQKKQPTAGTQMSPLARAAEPNDDTGDVAKTSQSMGSMCTPKKSQSTSNVSKSEDQQQQKRRPNGTRLKELRQRTSDLNLPLITALFNDSSLMESLTLDPLDRDQKSQSMSQIGGHHHRQNHHNDDDHHHQQQPGHRNSPVERSSTFRVDEAIGKSLLRKSAAVVPSPVTTKLTSPLPPPSAMRPISWHLENNGGGNGPYQWGCYQGRPVTTGNGGSGVGHHQPGSVGQRFYVHHHHHHLATPARPVVLQ